MKVALTSLESQLVIAALVILLLLTGGALTYDNIRKLDEAASSDQPARAGLRLLEEPRTPTQQAYQFAILASSGVAVLGLFAVGAYVHLLHRCFMAERQAEAAAYRQSDLFRATLSSIGDAVIATDPLLRITFLNAVAQELTGWSAKDAAGEPLANVSPIIHETTRDPMHHPAAQSLAEGRVTALAEHTLLVARDGTERPIAGCAKPICDARGETTGAIMVFRDVSDSRRMEEQFRQSQKMEAVGRLAGGIAHDFNNLLTVIDGYCQLVEDDPTISQNSRTFLCEIHRAADRAAALTQQLLAFSRSQVLQPTLIDLNNIVASASSLLKRLIGEDVMMHLDLAPDLPGIRADRGQIEQILINFAVNARDAMPSGGEIFVTTARVHINAHNSSDQAGPVAGEYVMLAFRDTGMGMDESVRKRVFDPYFTTKEYGKGTGLGLATVSRIVKQSEGFLDLQSSPGAGTTFQVYFPKADQVAAAENGRSRAVAE